MNTETDRELLKLAAKAAGIELNGWSVRAEAFWLGGEEINQLVPWNPLTDDGDALRLLVKLGMFYSPDVAHFLALERFSGQEHDDCTAFRRAIVRAAAAIGKAMP